MKERKSPVLSETIEKLRSIIARNNETHLPSVRNLARLCDVSPVTILRAISFLKNEGLVEGRWGTKNRVSGKKASVAKKPENECLSAAERTIEKIKCDIMEGKYPTHEPLPSIKQLSANYDVSYPSIKKALSRLQDESIIIPKGIRNYLFTSQNKPQTKIAVVAFGLAVNSVKIETERERNFYRILSDTAMNLNIMFETICCNDYLEEPQFFTPDDTPIQDYLKFRNITGIILSSYHMKDSAECLRTLLTFNIPISAWVEDHRILKMVNKYDAGRKKLSFFDSSYSTIPGFDVGKYLIARGHRHIAYISPFHQSPWSQNRLTGLKKAAASAEDVRIFPFVCSEYLNDYFFLVNILNDNSFVRHCMVSEIEKELHPFLWSRIASVKYEHDILLRDNDIFTVCHNFMDDASADSSITAWVCANDNIAVLITDYWNYCAVPLAQRPALIGFDNSFGSFERNITSYEFNTSGEVQDMLNHLLYPNSSFKLSRKSSISLSGRIVERAS